MRLETLTTGRSSLRFLRRMCGIAGYSLGSESRVARTVAARALLAGIAERGADAVGYAYREPESAITVHKQRSGATALLERIEVPEPATQLLVHVRDYTKGHPSLLANNHPIRHGAVVGIHNGIIENDDELFDEHGIARAEPGMTVDSEIIFALAERSRGRTADALQKLYGSMAAAWLDEGRPELLLARGMGRPLWVGAGKHELFFASTRLALELVESYGALKLKKSQLDEGSVLAVDGGKIVARETFSPDLSFTETPLPAVRAPDEARSCLARLATLHAAA
jgi:glucosamine 6-phosphate synthetase-like amidotransferase/phosphosugar isomerase protein